MEQLQRPTSGANHELPDFALYKRFLEQNLTIGNTYVVSRRDRSVKKKPREEEEGEYVVPLDNEVLKIDPNLSSHGPIKDFNDFVKQVRPYLPNTYTIITRDDKEISVFGLPGDFQTRMDELDATGVYYWAYTTDEIL